MFSTREPKFYKRLFQTNNEGRSIIKYPTVTVHIGNSKERGEIEYDLQSPLVEYHQNDSNTSCFISLEYLFTESGERNAARAILM